jgi:DNA-binding response OmpR family regulator
VDPGSLASLRHAFPDWEIEALDGASTASLARNWDPGAANLLVVGARHEAVETLGLCRGLRSQAGRAHTPVLVLVLPAQQALVRAALDAGADGCLVLPVHPKDLVRMMTRSGEGNQPGRHTLGTGPAQDADPWRDDGGEA